MNLNKYIKAINNVNVIKPYGKVTKVVGIMIEGTCRKVPIGSLCYIEPQKNGKRLLAEVVGFNDLKIFLMPFGNMDGIEPGSWIIPLDQKARVRVGSDLLGRVIDGLGNPIDGKGPIVYDGYYSLYRQPSNPIERKIVYEPLDVGIRAINGLLTLAKGQRIGILAGPGLGKSTLMGMIAKYAKADVNVIALIGERGREVKEFIKKNLGDGGLKKSVIVTATSDQPPLIRMKAAYVATAIAEYFRDQGEHVILMMDSITRFAMSAREIGLALGEPPTTKGYTPSVFSHLPQLLERTGNKEKGSITGIYNVLVEGDDLTEPIADAMQGLLDGHIILSRNLAAEGHYPCIDILRSVSRLAVDVITKEHLILKKRLIKCLSIYKKVEDLINIGAYKKGSNEEIDYAINMIGKINAYLRQEMEEKVSLKESVEQLKALFGS
ncbi:putative ATP synthase YscN [Candidatus Methanoperedenaceae archaeon GB50]|nr:putative ATP synthase YscN [Candidatus Methanoperedenaceae archaeon GB50]